jgi:photosystem II stability/assembly factor-like uncharacterized protein
MDKTTTRWLVVRDEAAGANAEVAYSDDGGVTWAVIEVDDSLIEGAVDSGALFALDKRHIWLVLSSGYIYFSSDGGETWTPQSEGTVTTEDLHAVHFSGYNDGVAVGDDGVVLITADGGDTWSAVTLVTGLPDVNCVYMFDTNRFVVGTSDGHIYMTFDGGTTWESKFTCTGSIDDIDFVNQFVGFAIKNIFHIALGNIGTVIRTRDGGETWETIVTPINTGLNAVDAITPNLAWAVGGGSANASLIKISG